MLFSLQYAFLLKADSLARKKCRVIFALNQKHSYYLLFVAYMKRLGTVLHRSGVKNLIIIGDEIKSDNVSSSLPKLNSIVVDKALNRVGTIVSVFGPVNHPYFLVKGLKRISDSEFRVMINERVYIR